MIDPVVVETIVREMKANKTVGVLAAKTTRIFTILKTIEAALNQAGIHKSHYKKTSGRIMLHLGGRVDVTIRFHGLTIDRLHLDTEMQAQVDTIKDLLDKGKPMPRMSTERLLMVERFQTARLCVRMLPDEETADDHA